MLADKEAEAAAAKVAIESRYEEAPKPKAPTLKPWPKCGPRKLKQYLKSSNILKSTDRSEKLQLISETDYRALPDEIRKLISVGMGGSAIKELLDGVDLSQLIGELNTDAETAKGNVRRKS